MQKKRIIVGLSGVAGSGKDTFFSLLSKERNFRRLALADELKSSIRDELINDYDIDILSCSREEKEVVRPRLIEFAKKMRFESKGRHWINKVMPKILSSQDDICITDVRYDDYENDEIHWLKNEIGGILVHISMYDEIQGSRVFKSAPNEEEARNDPKIKAKADFIVQWPRISGDLKGSVVFEECLSRHVNRFTDWLDLHEGTK